MWNFVLISFDMHGWLVTLIITNLRYFIRQDQSIVIYITSSCYKRNGRLIMRTHRLNMQAQLLVCDLFLHFKIIYLVSYLFYYFYMHLLSKSEL